MLITIIILQLLKDCSKVENEETLPIIYDDRNHLEVFDYVDDIYQYYWVMEVCHIPLLFHHLGLLEHY